MNQPTALAPALIEAGHLPDMALDATAAFHETLVPQARALLMQGRDVVVLFAAADITHDDWRLAAIRQLAREGAPARVNGVVVAADQAATQEAIRFAQSSPGITGQILKVDSNSAKSD